MPNIMLKPTIPAKIEASKLTPTPKTNVPKNAPKNITTKFKIAYFRGFDELFIKERTQTNTENKNQQIPKILL